jgi:multicomponent Na+:H+ antiporter subunit E
VKQIVLGFALILLWAAISADFSTANLVLGALVAFGALALLRRSFSRPVRYRKVQSILALSLSFLVELLVSALRVARIVLAPNLRTALKPAIIAFPLTIRSDHEIATLANLITLTPGTLSIDVSEDKSTLYVHVLNFTTRDAFIAELQNGFERRVGEVWT